MNSPGGSSPTDIDGGSTSPIRANDTVKRSNHVGNNQLRVKNDSAASRLRNVGLRMGLAMMKRAWRSDPSLFQESLELVRESFIDTMAPLCLYNSLPLSPFLDYAVSSFRSTFVDIIMDEKEAGPESLQQFVNFLLCFGISRGSVTDILYAVRVVLHTNIQYSPDSDTEKSVDFLSKFLPEKIFLHLNKLTSQPRSGCALMLLI